MALSRNELHAADPVALPPRKAIASALTVEGSRAALEQCRIDVVERVHAHHRVRAPCDLTRNDRHDAAIRADMELRGLRTEFIASDAVRTPDGDPEVASRIRSPHAAVF